MSANLEGRCYLALQISATPLVSRERERIEVRGLEQLLPVALHRPDLPRERLPKCAGHSPGVSIHHQPLLHIALKSYTHRHARYAMIRFLAI